MKVTRTLLLTILFCAATFGTQAAAQATSWKQIPIPPLPAFKPQQPKRIELANGMVIFLQEDHELPLIDGSARIRGGSINEPPTRIGLVDIYSEVWRTGGTKTQTGDQLDDFLEVRAAKVETGGSSDSTTISWSCLKGDLDDVFKVFADVLQNPEFRPDKIDIAHVRLEFASGAVANLTASRVSTEKVRKMRFFQEHEYVSIDFTRQDVLRVRVGVNEPGNPFDPSNLQGGIDTDQPQVNFEKLPTQTEEPLRAELRDFLDAVRTRRRPRVDGEAARRALELADRVMAGILEHARRVQVGAFAPQDSR